MYKITADDGNGNIVSIEMSAIELYRMMENSIIRGAIASQQIEGEGLNGSEWELQFQLQCNNPKIIAKRLNESVR